MKINIEGFAHSTLQTWMQAGCQLLVEVFQHWQGLSRTVPEDIVATLQALTSSMSEY